jgi:carbamoyltransferase
MKLLGIRICEHDSNFSYFDGSKVSYLKTERKYQIKHHGVQDLHIWKDIIYEEWGIRTKDLNEIAIVFDPWHHNLNTRDESFFPSKHIDFPVDCKTTRVNHHYAHHLSCWPLIKNGICIDVFGD